MTQAKPTALTRTIDWLTLGYRYLLGVFGVAMLTSMSGIISSSSAAPTSAGGNFNQFNSYICSLVSVLGAIIGGLAVIMVIAAGILYAASGGNEKGDLSMGAAKNMIVSAITGVTLYLLAGTLLGPCTATGTNYGYGPLLNQLLGRNQTVNTTK